MNPIEHVATSRIRLRSPVATAFAVLLVVAGALFLTAPPAHATGDPTLSALIISDPEAGWSNLSSAETGDFQTQIETEFQRLETANQTFSSAVGGWQSPQGASADSLVVFLVESIGSETQDITAASLASGFCSGATNANSVPTSPIPNVPDSAIATCSDTTQSVTVGTATKGNLLELIASFGTSPLANSAVEQVVGDQLDALPRSAPAGSSSSSGGGTDTAVIIGDVVGGVVIVAGAVIAFVMVRRRRAQPVVAAAGLPGAMPTPTPTATPAPFAAPAPVAAPAPRGRGLRTTRRHADSHVGMSPGDPPGPPPVLPGRPDLPGHPEHDPFAAADPGWVSSLDAPAATDHHADASVGSAPGWYPEGEDAETLRYWDGTTFTARRRWNGSDWVDA